MPTASEQYSRIAIVYDEKCKPKKCSLECKRNCPVVRIGKLCIEVTSQDKIALISESLCIGCGICVKKCPFDAIQIVNLPNNLEKETIHRYGQNQFKLHRLPIPRAGKVLGIVGSNGTGKSTALKILSGKLKPNLGKLMDPPPDWNEILTYFRGSELQNYFTKILEEKLSSITKPQYVDKIPRAVNDSVSNIINAKDKLGIAEKICEKLDLFKVLDRNVDQLSGGELQRFAIAIACIQNVDVYMFDEPSSYLDIKQRLIVSNVIRQIIDYEISIDRSKYIICVEHDLAILDYLSDYISILYGSPSIYGVVSLPLGVHEGINIFLEGYLFTENLRFRDYELSFKIGENTKQIEKRERFYHYSNLTKTYPSFKLNVEKGDFTNSEIIVLLGENGMGKTTFIRLLSGELKPDDGVEVPPLNVSYKPQKILPRFSGTVQELIRAKISSIYMHPQFQTDVVKPLNIEKLLDYKVQQLSGGEVQRVAITLCLGRPADIYLLDEPSAYLDSEQRVITAKVIKRFILHSKKTAFVVEHDFIMASYLADRIILYDGIPSINATASSPQPFLQGMNKFISSLNITIRRDPTNYRPRINKIGSAKDKEQKERGEYVYFE